MEKWFVEVDLVFEHSSVSNFSLLLINADSDSSLDYFVSSKVYKSERTANDGNEEWMEIYDHNRILINADDRDDYVYVYDEDEDEDEVPFEKLALRLSFNVVTNGEDYLYEDSLDTFKRLKFSSPELGSIIESISVKTVSWKFYDLKYPRVMKFSDSIRTLERKDEDPDPQSNPSWNWIMQRPYKKRVVPTIIFTQTTDDYFEDEVIRSFSHWQFDSAGYLDACVEDQTDEEKLKDEEELLLEKLIVEEELLLIKLPNILNKSEFVEFWYEFGLQDGVSSEPSDEVLDFIVSLNGSTLKSGRSIKDFEINKIIEYILKFELHELVFLVKEVDCIQALLPALILKREGKQVEEIRDILKIRPKYRHQ